MIRIYRSRHTPNVAGSEIKWQRGDLAYVANPSHPEYGRTVRIDCDDIMFHDDAPDNQIVLEVVFADGRRFAMLADNLRPV